jgi:membrane protein YdbS with pleckstrin-like domain
MAFQKLNSRIKWFWLLESSVISLFLSLVLSALAYEYTANVASLALIPLVFALGVWYGYRRYMNWGFEIRDDHLYIEHGVIKKVYSMVPFVRVQHIDTDRGPIDRMLGLSTLRVYTAGSKGADIKVPGLDREEASELQKKLRDSAIDSEKGFDAV